MPMSEPMNARRAAGTRALRWAGPVAAALLALVLLASGCSRGSGGPGVAEAGSPSSSPSTSASRAGDNHEAQLAYARCMRAHGITDFPDPPPQGGSGHGAPDTHFGRHSPQFQAADRACHSLLPAGSGKKNEHLQQLALEYAQCMRAHGISDFPDPDNGGGFEFPRGDASSDLNPNNPLFQAADQACKHHLVP
jgi:hypothetical protein